MIFLRMLELVLSTVVAIGLFLEVVWPLCEGTRLFPQFRRRFTRSELEVRTIRETLEQQQIEDLARKLRKRIHEKDLTNVN